MLKKITISKHRWVEIMSNYYPQLIEQVIDTSEFRLKYCKGYPDKSRIRVCGNTAIIPADVLLKYGAKITHPYQAYNYQFLVECGSENFKEEFRIDYTGSQAFNILKKSIRKYIDEDTFWARIKSFTDKKEDRPIMIHEQVQAPIMDVVMCYSNVTSIDINSAYGYIMMRDMFPEAKDAFEYYYSHRKSKPQYKQLFTHFSGMLKARGFDGAYWYIVHECRKIIDDVIAKCGGRIIYANTDGVKIQNADISKVNIDKKLGAFKVEHYKTDCYVYYGSNYSLVQIDGEQVGNCLLEAREGTDLSQGLVVKYKREKLFKTVKESPMIVTNKEIYKVGVIYE